MDKKTELDKKSQLFVMLINCNI